MIDCSKLKKTELVIMIERINEAIYSIGESVGLTEDDTNIPTIKEEIEKLKKENKTLRKTAAKYTELRKDIDYALDGTDQYEMDSTEEAILSLIKEGNKMRDELIYIKTKLGEAYLDKIIAGEV